MTQCQCSQKNRFPCRECRELDERESQYPYYGDCETNQLDEMRSQAEEVRDAECEEYYAEACKSLDADSSDDILETDSWIGEVLL
jgi:hypothetical protein